MGLVDIETAADADRYMRGSVIGVPEADGVVRPYVVTQLRATTILDQFDVALHPLAANAKAKVISWQTFSTDCILHVPRLGSVGQGNHVFYLTRSAARDWGRGLRDNTLHTINLSGSVRPAFSTLYANLYHRTYYSLHQANEELYNGRAVGRSLHHLWSLVSREDVPLNLVFYKAQIAGLCDENGRVTLLSSSKNLAPIWERTMHTEVQVEES